MNRCEACGERLKGSESIRTKFGGKVRNLCFECGSKIRQDEGSAVKVA
jgi:ribosome-binding protein aMBF1 (putative translation factor)